MYAVNPNGTLRWVWRTNDYIDCAPVIGKDGAIYFTGYTAGDHGTISHLYAIEPIDAADLRIVVDMGIGPSFGNIKIKLKNVGCKPSYNITCTVYIGMYNWRKYHYEIKKFSAKISSLDVNEEKWIRIKVFLNPLIYSPFQWDNSINLIIAEAETQIQKSHMRETHSYQ